MKNRYFSNSKSYFSFINKNKDKIQVVSVIPKKRYVKIKYQLITQNI